MIRTIKYFQKEENWIEIHLLLLFSVYPYLFPYCQSILWFSDYLEIVINFISYS